MANEKITESFVRDHFKNDPLYNILKFEEQKSGNRKIAELLQTASKTGKQGKGFPEFIVTFPTQNSNYIIVIECKSEVKKHQSNGFNKPKDFAVDGVLHYAKILSKEYEVIAIAVSGQNSRELLVSSYRFSMGKSEPTELKDKTLLSINDYIKFFNNEHFSESLKEVNIIQKAIALNESFHAYSITELSRCTIVSAILLSMVDNTFRQSYNTYEHTSDIAQGIVDAVSRVLTKRKVRDKDSMMKEFQTILNEPIFREETLRIDKKHLNTIEELKIIIDNIHKNIYPLIKMDEAGFDVLGKFYTEFIRYSGSEKNQGLVLTPLHITELFCDLANITTKSIVYDPCCGSGGFLISAMKRMLQLSGNDDSKKEIIKNKQLIGVEVRPNMFTYACSNMLFRGDGKSNIFCGDCFNLEYEIATNHRPNTVFLNPPYDGGASTQMEFIEHGLNTIQPNGLLIAIVQMSCAIKNEKDLVVIKKRLLDKNKLKAVISMPDELFNPAASVPTCIMVWESGVPNDSETWFGYLKNDGFVKRKHKGRVDVKKQWSSIRENFLKSYKNNKEIPGLSIKIEVSAEDEWCAEAYLETDLSLLSSLNFENKIRDLLAYKIKSENIDIIFTNETQPVESLVFQNWKWFKYGGEDGIFDLKNGYYNKKPEHLENGTIPFIGATEYNNGVTEYYSVYDIENANKDERSADHEISLKLFASNCITVTNNGSVGCAFYQENEFTCSHDVNVLYLKNQPLNRYISIFLCAIIELEKFRWAYGRKWRPSRMPNSLIKLPVTMEGKPDFEFMENYIKSLPYSSSI